MKNVISRRSIVALLTVAFVTLCAFNSNAQHPSFSGDWKMDEAKSNLGEFSGMVPRSIKADQKEDAITFTKVSPGFGGGDPITSTLTLTYDGKVVESEGFGGSKRKSTASWSDDGKTLMINTTINFDRDGEAFEVKSAEKWTLTKDGLLQVDTQTSSPMGENSDKGIYIK